MSALCPDRISFIQAEAAFHIYPRFLYIYVALYFVLQSIRNVEWVVDKFIWLFATPFRLANMAFQFAKGEKVSMMYNRSLYLFKIILIILGLCRCSRPSAHLVW